MKVRLKFQKYGSMKFVGHLDVMRYFQKACRRAGYDSEYSKGYNPHQVMSFASPLGLGLTSDSEYLDIGLHTSKSPEDMLADINKVMSDGFRVIGYHILVEPKENERHITAMSLVSSADYLVSLKDNYSLNNEILTQEKFQEAFERFYNKAEIIINKKSKTSEKLVDIKPMISMISFDYAEYREKQQSNLMNIFPHIDKKRSAFIDVDSTAAVYENDIRLYLQLDTGSVANLKPELVIEAFCEEYSIEYNPYAWQVHRLELYTKSMEANKLVPLSHLEH